MSFFYKLNYYKDEDGEYTEPKSAGISEVERIIENNWPSEGYLEDLRIVHISDDQNNQILLRNCKKGVFEVYYLDSRNNRHHYHKKSRIEIILDSMNSFMNSDYSKLKASLNKTLKNKKYLRKELLANHNYSLSPRRNRKELMWFFTLGIPFISVFSFVEVSILKQDNITGFNQAMMPILFILGLFMWLPGILIHWQYYKDNKKLKIIVTKGNPEIQIEFDEIRKVFLKSDIKTVIKYSIEQESLKVVIGGRVPWIHYGFTEIEFKNGEIVNMTNLIVDQLFILEKFKDANIRIGVAQRFFPFIKRKTSLTP